MKKILIIGGGAMGSAFSVPCLENNNKVIITEPYNKIFIKNLSSKQKFHPSLKLNLPKKLQYRKYSKDILKEKFDLIVIALSLAGIGDLYVSAAGGRNSKMGSYLGKGFTFRQAKKKFMPNDTIEGEQLVREIAPFILKKINKKRIPLMIKLINAILKNKKLNI